MRNQWIIGMNGATGLRLEALPTALRLQGVPRAQWPEVAEQVSVMESETLRLWRDKR